MSLNTAAIEIFRKGLGAVLPTNLVPRIFKVDKHTLFVDKLQYTLNKNVYVVGFGKAVLGMAKSVEEILNGHIKHGILSIPFNLQQSLSASSFDEAKNMLLSENSKIMVREGARNNLPDRAAMDNAFEIEKCVLSLKADDLLVVLVSGGGSALLPSPVAQISLKDKHETIKLLSENGSTIQDLNTIRKKLSRIKGGKLAALNKSCPIVSLILSDIVGDPVGLISSGPTVPDHSTFRECIQILERYLLIDRVPKSVLEYVKENAKSEKQQVLEFQTTFPNVQNIIVGNNMVAVDECRRTAENIGYPTVVLSGDLTGNVGNVASSFAGLLYWLIHDKEPGVVSCFDENLLNKVRSLLKTHSKVCLISAGETTVTVTGNGKGGRNQELALSTAISLDVLENADKNISSTKPETSFCFLSAGTDGQDGPTDAAGAFVNEDSISEAKSQGLNPERFLANNGSYDFFAEFNEGRNLFKTGLTGTNVMDIQILIVEKRQ